MTSLPPALALWRSSIACGLAALLASAALAQGVELKDSGTVYHGSSANCSQPATINHDKVRDETPEWKTIRSEGVRRGTARYTLLISEMNARIQRACRKAAEEGGRDCVVGHRDIKNDHGLGVVDLTDEVIAKLDASAATA